MYWLVLIVLIIQWAYLGIHFFLTAALEGWKDDGFYFVEEELMYAHVGFTCLLGVIGAVCNRQVLFPAMENSIPFTPFEKGNCRKR